jgi:hypothetical protein
VQQPEQVPQSWLNKATCSTAMFQIHPTHQPTYALLATVMIDCRKCKKRLLLSLNQQSQRWRPPVLDLLARVKRAYARIPHAQPKSLLLISDALTAVEGSVQSTKV